MAQRTHLKTVVFTAIAASLVACSSDSTGSASTDSAAVTTGADATTTAAPSDASTTTAAPTTTAPPPTTLAPIVLTLRIDGLGPFDFGAAPDEVVAGVTAQLGAPVRDEAATYPVDNGAGYWRTEDYMISYKFPTGRTVCWANGLCAAFGAADPAAPTFTGWVYQGDPAPTLSTDLGLTLGSNLADHPEVNQTPADCYNNSGADYDGLTWIGDFPYLFVVVRNADLVVIRLGAGEYRTDVGTTSCVTGA
ncbi:MAG: hypothetical protein K8R99_01585 [Actinomycetia bacterium]|nr:hypothetical protein [Actinomycetes bacterium]